jgi:hypothetical protein
MLVMKLDFAIANRFINALKKSEKGLLNEYQQSFEQKIPIVNFT